MLFNSLIFIYLFLPICILLTLIITTNQIRNYFLLIASLVFYSWGGFSFLTILLISILINYFIGILLGITTKDKLRERIFIVGILLNLIILIIFKYSNFLVNNFNVLSSIFNIKPFYVNNIILPLGISFYTFKAITYLIHVNGDKKNYNKNIIEVGLYMTIFPQIIAGPIDRYQTLITQIKDRSINFTQFSSGIKRFTIGLFKKVIISGPLAFIADNIFNKPFENLNSPLVWLGAICYTFQVYFDFSGYTDMAIGIGRLLGFEFTNNFNYPYISRSFREFWNRWHITLSTWFRDYVFQPLAYSLSKKLLKKKYLGVRTNSLIYYITVIITFTLCGFWHGAAWTFIVWGLIHGLLLTIEKTSFGIWLEKNKFISHLYFIFFLILSFVIFRSTTLKEADKLIGIMFGYGGSSVYWPELLEFIDSEFLIIFIIAILTSTPFIRNFINAINVKQLNLSPTTIRYFSILKSLVTISGVIFLLIIATITIVSSTNNSFLYFKF